MIDKKERSVAAVLEDVSFILNEVRNTKFKNLEETKLSAKQEKILDFLSAFLIQLSSQTHTNFSGLC